MTHTSPHQAKTTPDDLQVAPRDIRFDLDAVRQGHWLGGDPVGTAVFNALSLTFPDGERLFMDAVRNYRHLLSGKLLEDAKGFIAQEAIHSREHHQLNSLIDRERYPVAEVEEMVRARVKMARERGKMAMLVSTIALEHFTAMMAEMHARHRDLFDNSPPGVEQLWRWHAMEETEHKAVAYDVFLEATKDWSPLQRYRVRCRAMAFVTFMFTRNISRYAARLLEADGYTPKAALKAVKRFVWRNPGIFRRGWRTYLAWYRPGFHPWDQDDRERFADWKAEFDAAVA
ncbi:metal-dependent hydrolase [Caulobacter segnis]|uniref:metal-dependent hydrolase n=1 Tax=Caulobacter segnis TaxID=88688 RepID=UPI001CC145E1|nr:metal-dependent hydrolase [Caulobacter segnis]UAL12501.1 metal-dependent hydrolase [Caulobacter segnis]